MNATTTNQDHFKIIDEDGYIYGTFADFNEACAFLRALPSILDCRIKHYPGSSTTPGLASRCA